jgi:CheY-like chemotaxis protein
MTRPVLVVDDDAAIREAVRDVLQGEGIEVDMAADGLEALAKARQQRPRLVLLDMRMPRMDGWRFAQALRESGLVVPVVVMTAAADARRWAAEIGAVGLVEKPFAMSELIGAVERYSA